MQFKVLSATALMTILVWASADQLLTETAEVSVRIDVRGDKNSNVVASLERDTSDIIHVTVSGRQADVSRLRENIGAVVVVLKIGEERIKNRSLGIARFSLRELLRDERGVFAGCAVQDVQPENIAINIDRRITVTLPVRARGGTLDYSVAPRTEPDTLEATVLESLFAPIAEANPHLVLNCETYLADQPEAVPAELRVPIGLAIHSDLVSVRAEALRPDVVTLRATMRRHLKTGTVQAVPIKFLVSRGMFNRYELDFRDENPVDTLSITVTGPVDAIDRLVTGETKVFAKINIGSPDTLTAGSYLFFKPEFDLPPGVVLADDQTIPEFEIRLVPRAEPNSGPQSQP
jgi:hypothetical protein